MDCYILTQSLKDFGQPNKRRRASGAPQFAERSTKSQIGSPTIGRKSAVQKPQNIIQSRRIRIGFKRTKNARVVSISPTINKSLVARTVSVIPKMENHPIQVSLPCSAKTPCPKNSPATEILKTHSISFVFTKIILQIFTCKCKKIAANATTDTMQ